jgi:hypothetical protein
MGEAFHDDPGEAPVGIEPGDELMETQRHVRLLNSKRDEGSGGQFEDAIVNREGGRNLAETEQQAEGLPIHAVDPSGQAPEGFEF